MSRRWAPAALAGLLVATAVAGCGVTTDPKARAIAREDVRFGLLDTTTTTTTVPPTTVAPPSTTSTTSAPATTSTIPTEPLLLYFVRNGKLITEVRTLPVVDKAARIGVEATLDQLVIGPTTTGAQTFILPEVLSAVLSVGAGTARVALGPTYFALPPEQQVLALGQVVLTLTERPGIGRVLFRLPNDLPADFWKGDTTITSSEVSAEDYRVLTG